MQLLSSADIRRSYLINFKPFFWKCQGKGAKLTLPHFITAERRFELTWGQTRPTVWPKHKYAHTQVSFLGCIYRLTWVKQKANYIHLSKESCLVEGTAIVGLRERKRESVCVFHHLNYWNQGWNRKTGGDWQPERHYEKRGWALKRSKMTIFAFVSNLLEVKWKINCCRLSNGMTSRWFQSVTQAAVWKRPSFPQMYDGLFQTPVLLMDISQMWCNTWKPGTKQSRRERRLSAALTEQTEHFKLSPRDCFFTN